MNLIYKIANLINGKIYIGLTTNLSKRLKSHLYHAENGEGQTALHRALRKYGLSNVTFEVLEVVPDTVELGDRERHWIAHFRSNEKDRGYNLNEGGYQPKTSERTIDLMRKSAKNKVPVHVYDRDGKYVQSYESINAAARALNTRHCSVWKSINAGELVKHAFQIRTEKTPEITAHDSTAKGNIISAKMQGNRNGTRFIWRVYDSQTGETHEADSLLRVAQMGGYTEGPLRSLAYGRPSKAYGKRLTVQKIPQTLNDHID